MWRPRFCSRSMCFRLGIISLFLLSFHCFLALAALFLKNRKIKQFNDLPRGSNYRHAVGNFEFIAVSDRSALFPADFFGCDLVAILSCMDTQQANKLIFSGFSNESLPSAVGLRIVY